MKIFASNNFTPIKTLKKTAKATALAVPLMLGAQSCSSWLFMPPPPPCHHHRIPHHPPRPHYHPYPRFGFFGMTQPQDSVPYTDVFELSNNDMAYMDNTEQNK